MNEKNSNPVIYHLTYRDPILFPGWYVLYSVADGTYRTPGKFEPLLHELEAQLKREDNKNRFALVHYVTPEAFTGKQKESIESLLQEHNKEIPLPTEQSVSP